MNWNNILTGGSVSAAGPDLSPDAFTDIMNGQDAYDFTSGQGDPNNPGFVMTDPTVPESPFAGYGDPTPPVSGSSGSPFDGSVLPSDLDGAVFFFG